MGQMLHGSARTTEAVRRAIQSGQASIRALASRPPHQVKCTPSSVGTNHLIARYPVETGSSS